MTGTLGTPSHREEERTMTKASWQEAVTSKTTRKARKAKRDNKKETGDGNKNRRNLCGRPPKPDALVIKAAGENT